MSQPTLIGVAADGNTRGYTSDADSGASRVFTIDIPANANTMIVTMGLDADANQKTIDSLALTSDGSTPIGREVVEIDMQPNALPYRSARAAIYDLSGEGAFTDAKLTGILSGSTSFKSLLGVVCTDGFVESFTVTQDRAFQDGQIVSHSGNMANNTMVYMMVSDENTSNIAYASPATELYDVQTSDNDLSVTAASQSTTSNNTKTIAFSGLPANTDGSDLTLLLSSQPDPFDGITGKLTSPIIK